MTTVLAILVKTMEAALIELTDTPATVELGFWGNSVKKVSLLQCGQIAEKPLRLCSQGAAVETDLSYRKDTMKSYSSQLTKNEDNT